MIGMSNMTFGNFPETYPDLKCLLVTMRDLSQTAHFCVFLTRALYEEGETIRSYQRHLHITIERLDRSDILYVTHQSSPP